VSDIRAGLPDAIEVRVQQMDKRMKKLELATADMRPPERIGDADAPVTIVSWGSTQGAVREAMALLEAEGIKVASLEFTDIFPLDGAKVKAALEAERFTLMVEGNYTSQFERLIRAETGWFPDERLVKYDGEPFWPEEIVAEVKRVLPTEVKN